MKKLFLLITTCLIMLSCSKKDPVSPPVNCGPYEKATDNYLQGKWSFVLTSGSDTVQAGNLNGANQLQFANDSIYLYKNSAIVESAQYSMGNCGYWIDVYLPSFGAGGSISLRQKQNNNFLYGIAVINNNQYYFEMRR